MDADHFHLNSEKRLRKFEPFVRSLMAARIRGPLTRLMSVDDLVQEVLLDAITSSRGLPSTDHQMRAWLRAAVIHIYSNRARHLQAAKRDIRRDTVVTGTQKLEMLASAPANVRTPSSCAALGELVQALYGAVATLDEPHQRAVAMRHLHGLTHEQIAERLGCTPNAVRCAVHHAVGKLRERFRLVSGELSRRAILLKRKR